MSWREMYCWVCRAFVLTEDGTCPWCERKIEEIDLSRLPEREAEASRPRPVALAVKSTPRKPRRTKEILYDTHLPERRRVLERYVATNSRLRAGELAIELGIPFSCRESAAGSLQNLCRREAWVGADGKPSIALVAQALEDGTWDRVRQLGPPMGGRQGMSEAQIQEALWLYFYDELSFRDIATRMLSQTTYKSVRSLKSALNVEWNERGWPRRTPRSSGRLRGFAAPDASRRCSANSRDGSRCRRWVVSGTEWCRDHNPERQAEGQNYAERASDTAYRDAVAVAPLGWWLRAKAQELGSVMAIYRRVSDAVSYHTLSSWASVWSDRPASTSHASRGLQRVRRRTVDALLAAWGDGTTFEDLYMPKAFEGGFHCEACARDVVAVDGRCCLCGGPLVVAA